MDILRLEETHVQDFTIHNPYTGVISDADTLPTCAIFEDTTNTPIMTPTVVSRGLTGQYYVPIDCTTANGFDLSKCYNVVITATCNGVQSKSVILSFHIDTLKRFFGTVQSDAGNSATQFKGGQTETTNDHWKDCLISMITGSLAGQVKKVTGYSGSTKIFTFTNGFTGTPSNGDVYEIINI